MWDKYRKFVDIINKEGLVIEGLSKNTFSKYFRRIYVAKPMTASKAIVKALIAIYLDDKVDFFLGDIDKYHIIAVKDDKIYNIDIKDLELVEKIYKDVVAEIYEYGRLFTQTLSQIKKWGLL